MLALAHTGAINLFRLVACFNYYNQPPIIASHVCSCSCQEQAETISSVSRETNTISPLSLSLSTLCSVKAFNQALVYFLFVYYVIVGTEPLNVLCCGAASLSTSQRGETDSEFHN